MDGLKLDGIESNLTVICTKVDDPGRHLQFYGPSTFIPYFSFNQFHSSGPSSFSSRTVHFRIPSTLIYDRLLSVFDRQVKPQLTVPFDLRPSTLDLTQQRKRSRCKFDSKSLTQVHVEIYLEASDTQITVVWETISKD